MSYAVLLLKQCVCMDDWNLYAVSEAKTCQHFTSVRQERGNLVPIEKHLQD